MPAAIPQRKLSICLSKRSPRASRRPRPPAPSPLRSRKNPRLELPPSSHATSHFARALLKSISGHCFRPLAQITSESQEGQIQPGGECIVLRFLSPPQFPPLRLTAFVSGFRR